MSIPNTHYGKEYIAKLLEGKKRLFFDGIGGVSMCSLAQISHLRGHEVSGYDRTPSKLTAELETSGIKVYYDSARDHVEGVDALIYTVAMPESNEEYRAAEELGIPRISRADFLGYVMSTYRVRIGVSGMHGKSTTTSMLERIFAEAGLKPTVSCGAVMKDVGSAHVIGGNEFFIFEACEYMDSFLDFYPTTAVILNVEMDHVDYFHSMSQIKSSFEKFASLTGECGTVIVNGCDDNAMAAVGQYPGNCVTFGVDSPDSDYNGTNIRYRDGKIEFELICRGKDSVSVELGVPGEHYVWDSVAAAAAAVENGVAPDTVASALRGFDGAARRMEFCGKTDEGAAVYSDYAHHPTEVSAALSAAGHMGFKRIFCVFQPHTYSRTAEFIDSFAEALSAPHITETVINDIYAAREVDTLGVSAPMLADKVTKKGGSACYIPDFGDIADYLRGRCSDGDMILVMGAGDIATLTRILL